MARGRRTPQVSMVAFVDLEERVPVDHPVRTIKRLADAALAELSPLFDTMDAGIGRPSIPPERLLNANLLIARSSVRSERAFCEALDYHLVYRWLLDMNLMEPSFAPTTCSKHRQRLLKHEVADRFFAAVVKQADAREWLSDEHFTVDGTLIEAAASLKSVRPKDASVPAAPPDDPGNPTVNFRGERRSTATHASTTDPEARLAKQSAGKEANLAYAAHALLENRHGLLVAFQITPATGTAERDAVPVVVAAARAHGLRPRTLGAATGYDTKACVADLRSRGVTPHVAQNVTARRASAIDGRTTRHTGFAVSQRKRKRIEEIFGWMKTVGGFRRTRYRGLAKTQLAGYLVAAAYNLVRLSRLVTLPASTPTGG